MSVRSRRQLAFWLGIAAALAIACFTPVHARAETTWYVDGSVQESGNGTSWQEAFKTIQEGINAASDDDTVLVADGTGASSYTGTGNKNLDFSNGLPEGQTRAITVRSLNGQDNCTIDCQGSGRAFYFDSGETATSVVQGFTITKGSAANGGGV